MLAWTGFAHSLLAQNKELDATKAPGVNVDLLHLLTLAQQTQTAGPTAPTGTAEGTKEPYHWKGLLLQSFAFNGIENTFRILTDKQLRTLVANKPYWHDYIASMRQFNMHRWNDGDTFVVNYVGHSMQGAIAGYIQIQNDPVGRRLEIGSSHEYWKSRGWALLWSTVYSTQSEIGPLGEAALGNEGGWTYPRHLGCIKPCPTFKPGINTYTNNTGWVDFIITPVSGTFWIVVEDSVDRILAVTYQKHGVDERGIYPKILRGTLTPSRSFSNLLRGQTPWYRDWQHNGNPYFTPIHFTQSDERIRELANRPRFEISPHYSSFSIAVNTPACQNCRRTTTGAGIEMSYRINNWLDVDADLNRHPDASPLPSDRAGGNLYNGLFGIRTGYETEHYALKLAIRPGFVQFDNAYMTSPVPGSTQVPEAGTITHFALNIAASGDYRIGRNFALRYTLGQTMVRYRTDKEDPPGIGTIPYLSWLSHKNFINRGNWTFEAGPVFRFGPRRKQ
jgi:hypothetical protein